MFAIYKKYIRVLKWTIDIWYKKFGGKMLEKGMGLIVPWRGKDPCDFTPFSRFHHYMLRKVNGLFNAIAKTLYKYKTNS